MLVNWYYVPAFHYWIQLRPLTSVRSEIFLIKTHFSYGWKPLIIYGKPGTAPHFPSEKMRSPSFFLLHRRFAHFMLQPLDLLFQIFVFLHLSPQEAVGNLSLFLRPFGGKII